MFLDENTDNKQDDEKADNKQDDENTDNKKDDENADNKQVDENTDNKQDDENMDNKQDEYVAQELVSQQLAVQQDQMIIEDFRSDNKPDIEEKQEQLREEMHKGQAEEDIVEKQVLDEFDAVVKSIPSEEEITSLDASRDDEPKQKPLSLVDPVVEKGVSVNRSALEKIVS